MKKVERFECEKCKELFKTEKACREHEAEHQRIEKAEDMLNKGCTLKEINDNCHLWKGDILPTKLYSVTKDTKFENAAYVLNKSHISTIVGFTINGSVIFWPVDAGKFNKNNEQNLIDATNHHINLINLDPIIKLD